MQVKSLGFRTDLALLIRAGSAVEDRGDHLVVRSPNNPRYWWGNFVLVDHVPPPEECEQWVDAFAGAFPEADHVAIGFDSAVGDRADLAWFALRGFETDVGAVMTASRLDPPPSTNRGAVCRRLVSDEDWAQSVQLRLRVNERRVDDDGYRLFAVRRSEADRRLVAGGRAAWWGAFLGDRLVSQLGLVDAGGGLARYQRVETDPEHRRMGLAGTLVHRAAMWGLAELGVGGLVIVADPGYVAIDLYLKLGFEVREAQLGVAHPPEPATTL